jgi:hypothetical protein
MNPTDGRVPQQNLQSIEPQSEMSLPTTRYPGDAGTQARYKEEF